jgi:hypothetical protein
MAQVICIQPCVCSAFNVPWVLKMPVRVAAGFVAGRPVLALAGLDWSSVLTSASFSINLESLKCQRMKWG